MKSVKKKRETKTDRILDTKDEMDGSWNAYYFMAELENNQLWVLLVNLILPVTLILIVMNASFRLPEQRILSEALTHIEKYSRTLL